MGKLVCDICGGALEMQPGGQRAICSVCYMEYPINRLREMFAATPDAVIEPQRPTVADIPHSTVQAEVPIVPNTDFVIRAGELLEYHGAAIDIVIPENVFIIGERVFEKMRGIRSVLLPSKLRIICELAFYGCDYLQTINIPDRIEFIGRLAFAECASLTDVSISEQTLTRLRKTVTDDGFGTPFNALELGFSHRNFTNGKYPKPESPWYQKVCKEPLSHDGTF